MGAPSLSENSIRVCRTLEAELRDKVNGRVDLVMLFNKGNHMRYIGIFDMSILFIRTEGS